MAAASEKIDSDNSCLQQSSSSMWKESTVKTLSQMECSCPTALLQNSGVGSKSMVFGLHLPPTCPNSGRQTKR